MRCHLVFLLACCLLASACYAQVTLSEKDISLTRLFKQIRKQTGYKFVYNDDMLPKDRLFDVDVKNASVEAVLDKYLQPAMLTYEIRADKTVVIQQVKQATSTPTKATSRVQGQITDENGQPLPGATIAVKGTRSGGPSGMSPSAPGCSTGIKRLSPGQWPLSRERNCGRWVRSMCSKA